MTPPRYASTRGGVPVSFRTALLDGLAPEGGLYLPTYVPPIRSDGLSASSFADAAVSTLAPLLEGVVSGFEAVVRDALPFDVPLVDLEGEWAGISVLELFYGPTLSFKDVGARTMARLVGTVLEDEEVTILAATSGDTGSAVADGFAGIPGVRVVLLYPKGQVSAVQERQLSVERPAVQALAVEGTFDDCQRMVKSAFATLRKTRRLSSANSINVGRLLPQMTYYAWAAARSGLEDAVFCVPSGNLGNLTAGTLAHRAGVPAVGFIAAHNANDGFPRFLEGADAPTGDSVRTVSNAMDVGVPSNLERLRVLYPGDALRRLVTGEAVTDAATFATMRAVWDAAGYLADPHTAVGLEAARRYRERHDRPVIVLATAHPAKFPDAVLEATGTRPEVPDRLARLWDAPTRVETIPADLEALAAHLD